MKKAAIAMVITSAFALSACQKQEPVDPLKVEALSLEADEQKQAYALGSSFGEYLKRAIDEHNDVGIQLDKEIVIKAVIATIQEQSQLTPEEVKQYASALSEAMRAAQTKKSEQLAQKNIADGQAYLAENAKREGVNVTESGLQYEVLTSAEGAKPAATDTVKVHYKGTLLDGTEFDSSYSRGEPAVFPLNRVISGWTEGLQLMNEGAKFKFVIPSELAYGKRATGKITANSTLIFEVELLEVMNKAAEQ